MVYSMNFKEKAERGYVEITIKHDSEILNLGDWGNPRKELDANQRFILNLHNSLVA